ncbi:MAG TPA: hypothetical protein VF177_06500, partial [Anaerolineae bacterium]
MSNQTLEHREEQRPAGKYGLRPQLLLWVLLGIILLLSLALLSFFVRANHRPLKPLRPTPTPGSLVIGGEPILVTFPELSENPFTYLNQRIRVSGDYTPLPRPDCIPYSGPKIRWALVADNLQLNAIGFEPILRLVEPETALTVEGIWRLYDGPAGCGKAPPSDNVWYLEVERIIQPNPLTGPTGPVGPGPAGPVTPPSSETTTPTATAVPTATPTFTPSASATTTTTPALTPSTSVTATATAGSITPTATFPGTVTTT